MHSPHSPAKSTTGARKKACVKFDTSLFDPASLRDEVVFENAIAILEGYLANPEFNRDELLLSLSGSPTLLALVLSSLSSTQFNPLREDVFKSFPATAGSFAGSSSATLLTVLTHVFGSLGHPASNLDDCQRAVQLAPPVLDALAILCAVEDVADNALEASRVPGKRRMTQSWAKKVKRANQIPYVDAAVFDRLEVAVPTSRVEAMELASKVLGDQKNIISYYFDVLRRPELSAVFKNAYIPTEIPDNVLITSSPQDEAPSQEPILPELFANTQVHNTYTTFEPLTANLFFGSAEGFGDWRIIIAQKASKDLRDACKKNPPLYDTICKKLCELSHGYFSGDNQKRLAGPDNGIPIFEAKMLGDSRLVYRIDCVQEYGSEVETQALRVYGIYTHAKMRGGRFWDAVSRTVGAGREYRSRCLYRTASTGSHQDVTYPASWPPLEEKQANEEFIFQDLSIEDKQELRSLVVMEHFVPVSQALMNSINENYDITHPFYISPEEQAIVQYNGSSFVLGRSGTGKTTAIVYKMVGLERSWMLRHEDVRQTTARPRQIFVTQSRVLAEKVEDYFYNMFSTVKAEGYDIQESSKMAAIRTKNRELTMVDKDEEGLHRKDLPKRWSELTDDHFPLFVTSDHLWRLLEADFAELQDKDEANSKTNSRRASKSQILQTGPSFVSYNQFLNMYWAHFPQDLVKGVVPSAAFAEFMGVIKGSEKTLRSEKGYLDKGTYCQEILGTSSFSGRREAMYALFEAYTKMKKRHGQYDAADRTHTIIRNLMQHGVPGGKVHYVFVDEAQDNLLIDSLILRYLCVQPNGLLWAGDTAQTISAGSTFRFQELTALMHRVEQGTKRHRPQFFQLTKNYRSHGGIVRCAQTIVDLLSKLWPRQIDILAEEEGVIDGPLPTYFSGGEQHAPRFEQFLSDQSGGPLAFGAEQCILVRDEEAKTRLRAELGEIGIIMTLLDSKGLEFDDILLYNFFTDSSLSRAQWRVVLNGLPDGHNISCPAFNEEKHHGVCGELKRLYVGVTRARMNLWFFDYSDTGEPMRILWESRGQVKTWSPGMPVPPLVKSSSLEQWAKKADQLFDNKNWSEAQLAYRQAQMPREEKIAEAYYLRDIADKEPANSRAERTRKKDAFTRAATAFEAAAERESSALKRQPYLRIAAECYAVVDDHPRAAVLYERASEFQASALHYRRAGIFDDAVRIIQTFESEIEDADFAEEILDVSKLFYFQHGHIEKAKELFTTADEAVEFTDTCGLDAIRATLLEEKRDYVQAAELRLQEGNIADAVRLFLQAGSDEAAQRACKCILDKLWGTCRLDTPVAANDARLLSLLSLASSIPPTALSTQQDNQLAMFMAISTHDYPSLQVLCRESDDMAVTITSMNHIFLNADANTLSVSGAASQLWFYWAYFRKLQQWLASRDLCDDVAAQRLLSFSPGSNMDTFHIHPHSVMSDTHADISDNQESLAKADMEFCVKQALRHHLIIQVLSQNEWARRMPAFKACSQFALDGHCRLGHRCPWSHEMLAYQLRITILLLQIRVYQITDGFEGRRECHLQRRYWLASLDEALHPAIAKLGAPHCLDTTAIPSGALDIAKYWIREELFTMKPERSFFLTQFFRSLLMSKTISGTYIPDYLYRTPRYKFANPPWLFSKTTHVVHDTVRFLGRGVHSLTSGILIVRHILDNRLPIDLGSLCDILDALCGALILAQRVHCGSLHGLILPRSWLLSLSDRLQDASASDIDYLSNYVEPMSALLRDVYCGITSDPRIGHTDGWAYRFGKRNIGYHLISAYLARICQNLCLFGYNISNYRLREDILQCLGSLRRSNENREFHSSYGRYIMASRWSHLAREVHSETFRPSAMDDMVELWHSSKLPGAPPVAHRQMNRLIFTSPQDVYTQLVHASRPTECVRDGPRPGPSTSVPASSTGTSQVDPPIASPSDGATRDNLSVAAEMAMQEAVIERKDIRTATSVDQHSAEVDDALSERDKQALLKLVAMYRRMQQRRSTALSPMRSKFAMCHDLAKSFGMFAEGAPKSVRHYRAVYLGPFLHLLQCIQDINRHLRSEKVSAKKRLIDRNRGHLQLEEALRRMTTLSTLCKRADSLEKILDPRSIIHRNRDLHRLKQLVSEVQQLLDDLPSHTVADSWREDLRIAHMGIVLRRPSVKKPLPALNTEDLDQYAFDV